MKILYVVDQLQDLTSDPLYFGLIRLLGQQQVIDFPSKDIFHRVEAKRWFFPLVPSLGYDEAQVRDLLRDGHFDCVCLASARPECYANLRKLYSPLRFPPVVFLDGADDCRIRHDVVAEFRVAMYFKRDYVWGLGNPLFDRGKQLLAFRGDHSLIARTFPLPLSIVADALPNVEHVSKQYDVSYRGHASHPRRAKAVHLLSSMENVAFSGGVYLRPGDKLYKLRHGFWSRLWTKTFKGEAGQADLDRRYDPDDYYKEILASRIAVHIRGGGHTATPRYFEIVALGTMLISDTPETLIPNDFEHGRHAVFCKSSLSDLQELVCYYIRHPDERETIARNGRSHLLKHHTCERRAEYFLDVCRKLL
jgi:hypothetical protein